jgi:hypothetical protein
MFNIDIPTLNNGRLTTAICLLMLLSADLRSTGVVGEAQNGTSGVLVNHPGNEGSNQTTDLEEFQSLLSEYVDATLSRNLYDLVGGAGVANSTRQARFSRADFSVKAVDRALRQTLWGLVVGKKNARAAAEGRLFFFKG